MTGTERKVFQKYYPPDFDPKKLKKERGKKRNLQFVQRVMAPFNMQCNTCNEYIYKGKKFNMRRETAEGEQYLGMKIFRFYFRCPNCLAEISFKTDIENVDYTAEHGATRLFEAFKSYQEQERRKEEKEEAEKNDPMKMLEKRTQMSRKEMEAIGKLEELQEHSKRQQLANPLEYLANADKQQLMSQAELLKLQEEMDEREIARIMAHKTVRAAEENEEIEVDELEEPSTSAPTSSTVTTSSSLYKSIRKPTIPARSRLNGLVRLVKKPTTPAAVPPTSSGPSSLLGLADYGSSSSEEAE